MRLLLTLVILAIVVLVLFLIRDRLYGRRREFFGMSPGTLDQLQSTHVYNENDFKQLKGYTAQVNRDLIDMTGSPLIA